MRLRRAVLPSVLLVAFAARADGAPDTLEERLGRGEVVVEYEAVEGFKVPALRTHVVIDASPADVFALVDDCAAYPEVMPHVATASEASREGDKSVCRWVVDMPFPIRDLATEVEVTRAREPNRWVREFHQTKGDFVRNEGTWTLTPHHGDLARTRVDYRLFVAMDTVLPDSFVRHGQRAAMGDMVRTIRARLGKGR